MTYVVKGRCYYDTFGRRWRAIAVTKEYVVLRRYLVQRTSAQRKEDGKWLIHYNYYGFVNSYLIVEGDR